MPLLNWDTLFKEVWQPCRDLYEEMATIEQKRRNLIRRPSEPEDAYNNRVKAAYLDNHFGVALRSYAALLGKFCYTKEPNEPPETITEANKATPEGQIASNIDFNGNDFKAILSSINQMALCMGASLVVVDVDGEKENKRPYLKQWDLDQLYYRSEDTFSRGIVTIVEGGRTYIASFCGKYTVAELDDKGSLKDFEYYLEYNHRPAKTKLWKMVDGKPVQQGKENQLVGANGKKLEELPVVWHDFNGSPAGVPPLPILFRLARLNITHFNSLSELQTILTVVNGPTPYRVWPAGQPLPEERPDMFLGINAVADMPGGSSLGFLEPSGNAISLSKVMIDSQVEQMQQLGQQFLSNGGIARTATEAMLDRAKAETLLLDMAARVENTAEEIFKWWRVFEDPTYEYPNYAGGIEINSEALLMPVQPEEVQVVIAQFLNGLLDVPTALNILRRKGAMKDEDLSPQMKKLMGIEDEAMEGEEEEPEEKESEKEEAQAETEPEEPEHEEGEEEPENQGSSETE